MSQTVDVIAIIKGKKGQEAAIKASMKACQAPSRAEKTNQGYEATQDIKDPSVFVMLEKWESEAALQEHIQTPHFKKLIEDLSDKLAEPMNVHVLKNF